MLTPIVSSVIGKQVIADNTLEFVLKRPDDFQFKAGQHVNVKLVELLFDDKRGGRRMFTLASAPSEDDLLIATRMTGSGFKRTIEHGHQLDVEIIGPRGNMIRDESRPAVFLAGGIGITPFRSMVVDAIKRQLEQPITLLYSNSYLDGVAYHDYFDKAAQEFPDQFFYVETITKDDPKNIVWQGERRRIDLAFVKEYVSDLSAVTFYICGPPVMVTAMTAMLEGENVSSEHILSESFWGY